jgi:hypothetical protein
MLYLTFKFQLEWKSACLGAPNVWCLCKLSTRTDQRAAYFFCQKYRKPRFLTKTLFTREKDKIVLFTTHSNSVSQMCRNTVTFVKTLFTDPVNSKTTVYRKRESRTDLVWLSLSPHPSIYRKCGITKMPSWIVGRFQSEKTKIPLKFIQFTKMSLGFWPNYRNTLGILAKLPK